MMKIQLLVSAALVLLSAAAHGVETPHSDAAPFEERATSVNAYSFLKELEFVGAGDFEDYDVGSNVSQPKSMAPLPKSPTKSPGAAPLAESFMTPSFVAEVSASCPGRTGQGCEDRRPRCLEPEGPYCHEGEWECRKGGSGSPCPRCRPRGCGRCGGGCVCNRSSGRWRWRCPLRSLRGSRNVDDEAKDENTFAPNTAHGIMAKPHIAKLVASANKVDGGADNPCKSEVEAVFACLGEACVTCFSVIFEDYAETPTCESLGEGSFCADVKGCVTACGEMDCAESALALESCAVEAYPDAKKKESPCPGLCEGPDLEMD